MLFAFPFNDMTEYQGEHSKKKEKKKEKGRILLSAICMASVWQRRSDETHLER